MNEDQPLPEPEPTQPAEAYDAAIDAAFEASAHPAVPTRPPTGGAIKTQWDKEIEEQLEEALKGFEAKMFDAPPPRRRPAVGEKPAGAKTDPKAGAKPTQRPDRPGAPKPETVDPFAGKKVGKVIAIRGKNVFVELGAKAEGIIPLAHFEDNLPKPGDPIEIIVDRFDEDEGMFVLARWGSTIEARWETLRTGQVVEARATKVNKGGLDVDIDGIRGFLPIGQIDINRVEDASQYLNQKFPVVVMEANQRQLNLVVSRREWLERKRAEEREKTWATLAEGQTRSGVVRSVKDQWAFIDLGGVDGFLHVSEAAWTRVKHMGDILASGQEVKVKILKIDKDAQKVTLGLKQLIPSPWDSVESRYARGSFVRGKVTKVMDFGAFVELEPGVEGLVHISELSPNRVRRTGDIVKPGQEVEVRVLSIDLENKKMSLSLKPLPGAIKDDEPPEDESEVAVAEPKREVIRKVPLKGGLGGANPFAGLLGSIAKDPAPPENR